jgi:hypothetical protein
MIRFGRAAGYDNYLDDPLIRPSLEHGATKFDFSGNIEIKLLLVLPDWTAIEQRSSF